MAADHGRDTATLEEEEQFVVFRLAQEEYGVPIGAVQEIVRVPENLTRLPKAPAFIQRRRQPARLGAAGGRPTHAVCPGRYCTPNDRQRIMVFTIDGVRTGFIVDSVSEVLKIPRSRHWPDAQPVKRTDRFDLPRCEPGTAKADDPADRAPATNCWSGTRSARSRMPQAWRPNSRRQGCNG